MRAGPFASLAEIDVYLASDTIECLECGRQFRNLGKHVGRAHAYTPDEYRQKWGIPAMAPLAGQATRRAIAERLQERIAAGLVDYSHLARASEIARDAQRWPRVEATHAKQREVAARTPRQQIEVGGRRADGRDAERARNYQREYRARRERA